MPPKDALIHRLVDVVIATCEAIRQYKIKSPFAKDAVKRLCVSSAVRDLCCPSDRAIFVEMLNRVHEDFQVKTNHDTGVSYVYHEGLYWVFSPEGRLIQLKEAS